MPKTHDVIVLGCGAMGSAALAHLARRGLNVLGLDTFHPPHTQGSSHGQTRIIREAYFEHPSYVPLVQRAYQLWKELEDGAPEPLFLQTGGLMIGETGGVVFEGARRSAELHSLPHQILAAEEIEREYPAFRLPQHLQAVREPRAGILYPEKCVAAHLASAQAAGAELRFGQRAISWKTSGSKVKVQTETETLECAQLILSAGAWLPKLASDLGVSFKIERQILAWFEPSSNHELFHSSACPIFLVEYAASRFFYGFPDVGSGVKLALHHEGEAVDPNQPRRDASAEEIETLRRAVLPILPDAPGRLLSSTTCLYTNTPDGHFILDRHPESPQVIVARPCSGHGFKFASAIGEALSDMACGAEPRLDLSLFRLSRFNSRRH